MQPLAVISEQQRRSAKLSSYERRKVRRAFSRLISGASPDVCMDVAAWANEHGCFVARLHPAVIDEVRPYIGFDRVAQEEFRTHRVALERAQTLVTIEGATIRDVVGLV